MLNNSQLMAVTHNKGPAMIVAGPGSGKTYTIIQRILYLVQNFKVLPSSILVLTFSKNAANEMKNRYFNETSNNDVHFATFHSLAYHILKEYFGLNSLTIINDNQKFNILKNIIKTNNLSIENDHIYSILSEISKIKNTSNFNKLYQLIEFDFINRETLCSIIDEYNELLQESNYIDFDDMVLLCIHKLKNSEKIRTKLHDCYKYILIDEFQDINNPQYELINILKGYDNNIFVVGDDDQSIYGFRGACPSIMQQFQKDNISTKIIYMSENYRCKSNIVELSSLIINDNKNRFNKNLSSMFKGGNIQFNLVETRQNEEDLIRSYITDQLKNNYNQTAIIVRTNIEVYLWKNFLERIKIPVSDKTQNMKDLMNSFISNDIKSFINYIFHGHSREDFIGFMNKPSRLIQRRALINEHDCENDLLKYYKHNSQMMLTIQNLFSKLRIAEKSNPHLAIQLFRKTLNYDSYIMDISKDNITLNNNINNLNTIHDLMKEYKISENIDEYLLNKIKNTIIYTENDSKKALSENGINIITMHTSKGLEFDNVILPDINEGVIPPKNVTDIEVEEERRLFYVAVTRAKNNLLIISTKERNRDVSRFIKDKIKYINHIN